MAEKLHASAVAHIACPGVLCVQPGLEISLVLQFWRVSQQASYEVSQPLVEELVERLIG